MRLELGSGEKPHGDYDIHADVLSLADIEVVCRIDELPFADRSISALRANHVLEHQSYELVDATLREWARVLRQGAPVEIGVPDARFIASQWVTGEIDTPEANYWLLGGHSDRPAHKGVDERGAPRWIWNAHHTLFDAASLRAHLEDCGFVEIRIVCYDVRNLRCNCKLA